jgi:hypothetical protein
MRFGDINAVYCENRIEYLNPTWKACRVLHFKADVTCDTLCFKWLTRERWTGKPPSAREETYPRRRKKNAGSVA